jgi:tetratricopeptide (TPR) repeat protein
VAEANSLAELGVLLAANGELDDAQRLLEESVLMSATLGNIRSVGNWSRALGGIARLKQDSAAARRLFEESLAILRSLDDAWGISGSLANLALLAFEDQDIETAKRLLDESLELERKASYAPRVASSLEVSARLAVAQGRQARAARLFGAAGLLRESTGADPCEVGWPDPAPEIAGIRAAIDTQDFEAAWEQGRAMSIGESIAYALEEETELQREDAAARIR